MKSSAPPNPLPEPLDLATALRRILGSGEIDCDVTSCPEVRRIIDEYAERIIRGEDVAECMPVVKAHLEECPDCCAECAALLRILELEGSL